jgi:flagellar FliL protein
MTQKSNTWWLVMLMVLSGLLSMQAWSADEPPEEAEAATEEMLEVVVRPTYVSVKPAFVVNYGGEGKLRYMKAEISLRVEDVSSANAVRHHMPLVRDSLVKLFSRQTDADIDTPNGKEELRLKALKSVQDAVEQEEGEQGVINLYFSHFVVQK